ncbi:hypothetical protein [Methylobacterium durans]|uniref:hypothetical protein n=1 Tax=Methylobacterium durans TaxID=2202825 RepID=UPI0013A58B6E|nr:hypothetical protein [Methylobacterium durans]
MRRVSGGARLRIVVDGREPSIGRTVAVPLSISHEGLQEIVEATSPGPSSMDDEGRAFPHESRLTRFSVADRSGPSPPARGGAGIAHATGARADGRNGASPACPRRHSPRPAR